MPEALPPAATYHPKTYKNPQFNNLWPERKIKSLYGSIKFTSAEKYLAWVLGRKGLFIGFLQQPSTIKNLIAGQ
jgi:hypothetical protein